MGQGNPGRQHQAAGIKSRPKKTFHNVSFCEPRGTAVRAVEVTRVCAANRDSRITPGRAANSRAELGNLTDTLVMRA